MTPTQSGTRAEDPRLEPFDYVLPDELVARFPSARREDARLMVVGPGAPIHRHIPNLVNLTRPGDVLVVNNTRVLPARVHARRLSGGAVELLFLGVEPQRSGSWAMCKPARRLKPGEVLTVLGHDGEPVPSLAICLQERGEDGAWSVVCTPSEDQLLTEVGEVPLPPYLRRAAVPSDVERYQTVFAGPPGAVAAPTAGLHLTNDLLAALQDRGVKTAEVTLHVGAGTFRNLRPEDLDRGRLHAESYTVSASTRDTIAAARAAGGRVIAVGTTSARTLEAASVGQGLVRAGEGVTDLFIRPGYEFAVVDGMLTNFHLPRSSLLMLVSALAGVDRMRAAYAAAVHEGYRFFSYGDAMFIPPPDGDRGIRGRQARPGRIG